MFPYGKATSHLDLRKLPPRPEASNKSCQSVLVTSLLMACRLTRFRTP